MGLTFYGLKNCDSCRKAIKAAEARGLAFDFHDFKKTPLDAATLDRFLAQIDLDILLNRRGTTWRKLSDADKANSDAAHLRALMLARNALLKRPIIDDGRMVTVGWSAEIEAGLAARA